MKTGKGIRSDATYDTLAGHLFPERVKYALQ